MDGQDNINAGPQADASSSTGIFTIADLKRAKIWLCGNRYGPNGEKTGGQPLNARTGEPGASSTDPNDYDTYEVAAATAERLGLHVGLATGPIPGTKYTLVSNDIDNAVGDDGFRLFAKKMLDVSTGMVAEVSRGQKGLHHYGIALTKDIENLRASEWKRKVAFDDMTLEFYVHGQYLIAPGWPWPEFRREGVKWWDDDAVPMPLVGREQLLAIHAVMEEFEALSRDFYIPALKRQKLYKSMGKKGRVNIRCPWRAEHSPGETETECIYWPADAKRKKPGFNCKHAHCEGKRRIRDLDNWLKKNDSQFKEDLDNWAREEREKRMEAARAGRAEVSCDPEVLHIALETCRLALIEQRKLYRQGRGLVVVDMSTINKEKKPRLSLVKVTQPILIKYLQQRFMFVKRSKIVLPDRVLLDQLLDYEDDKPMGLPPLFGIMTTPFLRRDGTICNTPGYDEATGTWYDPCGIEFPPLPEITLDNARAVALDALGRLLQPLHLYQFDTSEPADSRVTVVPGRYPAGGWNLAPDTSRAAVLSMLLTTVAMQACGTLPFFLIDAPVRGSGKTKLGQCGAVLASGQEPAMIDGKTRNLEEFEKKFDSYLLAGVSCIVIDNLVGDIDRFGRLAAAATGKLSLRRFFNNDQVIEAGDMMIILVGNQARATGDIPRRSIVARIDTKSGTPDSLDFAFDPVDMVMRNRPQLVIDCLTVLRAYAVAGSPGQKGKAFGSFERWGRLVRDPLLWLGLPDVAKSNRVLRDFDDSTNQLRELLPAWEEAGVTGKRTCGELARSGHRVLLDALLNIAPRRDGGTLVGIDLRELGLWLSKNRDVPVNGRRIRRTDDQGQAHYELIIDPLWQPEDSGEEVDEATQVDEVQPEKLSDEELIRRACEPIKW
jgi:hypothetical protein